MYGISFLSRMSYFLGGQKASEQSAQDASASAAAQADGALGVAGPAQEQRLHVPQHSHPPESGSIDSLPLAVQRVALEVQLQPALPAQTSARVAQQPSVSDLTPLCLPRPGSLATNAAVIEALEAHAQAADTAIARDAIVRYIALGECAVREIQKLAAEGTGADAANAGPPKASWPSVMGVTLTPNLEVIRAISWYVVACAAQQDANQRTGQPRLIGGREVTDLSIGGSYMFKDPNRAIYHFMNSSPLAYPRISTHFNERSEGALNSWGQADQRGIEDYDRLLPGENGTVLFDQLKDVSGHQVMFVKFEHAGVPPVDRSAQMVDEHGSGSAPFYRAAERMISHALSFIWTRFAAVPEGERKEHVYKGPLKKEVHLPFMELIEAAQKMGLLSADMTAKEHEKRTQERGLPHLIDTLAQLKENIDNLPSNTEEQKQLGQSLDKLREAIENVTQVLGAQSNHLQITRRGAETHVDMAPPNAQLEKAKKKLTTLEGDAASPPGPLEPYELEVSAVKYRIPAGVHADTAREWATHGIEINGVAYRASNPSDRVAHGVEGTMSTLEQACEAFVAACGNNPMAAEWISRFARQALAEPLLEYLRGESLGTVGPDMDLSLGRRNLSIRRQEDGAVELSLDFSYENSEDAPVEVRNAKTNVVVQLDKQAQLHASVTLRFEGLGNITAQQAPQPKISKPLTYTTSNFELSFGDYVIVEDE